MTAEDVVAVAAHAPEARVVAVHMEAINHCLETRADLHQRLHVEGLASRVTVPEDAARAAGRTALWQAPVASGGGPWRGQRLGLYGEGWLPVPTRETHGLPIRSDVEARSPSPVQPSRYGARATTHAPAPATARSEQRSSTARRPGTRPCAAGPACRRPGGGTGCRACRA